LALGGIGHGAALPAEITVDPDALTAGQRAEAGVVQLSSRQSDSIAALEGSTLLRAILGDAAVDALLAVRRYEQRNYCDLTPAELTDRFRMAWSV
jgi:glutamine synthetase